MACLPSHGYIVNPSVIPFSQKREVTYRSISQTGENKDLVVVDAGRSRRKTGDLTVRFVSDNRIMPIIYISFGLIGKSRTKFYYLFW